MICDMIIVHTYIFKIVKKSLMYSVSWWSIQGLIYSYIIILFLVITICQLKDSCSFLKRSLEHSEMKKDMLRQRSSHVTLCKAIWVPESTKFFCEILNPRPWNLKFSTRNLSGLPFPIRISNPNSTDNKVQNPVSSRQWKSDSVESRIQDCVSWITLHGAKIFLLCHVLNLTRSWTSMLLRSCDVVQNTFHTFFFCKQGAKNCSLSAHDAITCNQASYPHIYLQKWSQR